jgi:hypothetical protein
VDRGRNEDPEKVEVADQWGNIHSVTVVTMPGNGMKPRLGERWIIDRRLGQFTFVGIASQRRDEPVDEADCTHAFMFGGV